MTVFACNHNFRVATVGRGTPPLKPNALICVCEQSEHVAGVSSALTHTHTFFVSFSHTFSAAFPRRV